MRRPRTRRTRQRDYAVEYASRIAAAFSRGLSRSQARGHPRAGETPIRTKPPAAKFDARLEEGFKEFRNNRNLTATARDLHISRERLRSYIRQNELAERRGRQWIVTDRRPKPVVIYSRGRRKELVAAGLEEAQLAGAYWNDANRFLSDPDRRLLEPYVGRSVVDVKGVHHPLETDPNGIYRAANESGAPFEDIYQPTV